MRFASLASELPPGVAAARDGDLGALRALLAGGWEPASAVDRHGSSALLWAAAGTISSISPISR